MKLDPKRLRLTLGEIAAVLIVSAPGTPVAAQPVVGDGSVACGKFYTISSGDTLSEVAARAYGDPMLYDVLVAANSDVLGGDPGSLGVGMTIEIPCLDVGGEALPVEAAAADKLIQAAVAAEGPLSPAQLDTLFGPVALFPDPVLTPVLVAVTFPLDLVKAGRFVEAFADLPDRERATEAAAQPWDESVRNLAAAFPDLVTRMSDHIDWTEQAGEAVLAQTDDVLASIQRLRATAQENGFLVDNDAQDVQTEGDTIVIAPADPRIVYVPTYDSQIVYASPITTPPDYYYGYDYNDDGDDMASALVAGGIMLGSAVILDEIFDDDDDWDGWDDWGDDADIDWDGGAINIDRGDINVDGDVNIGGGDRANIGGGDRASIDEGLPPGIGDRNQASTGGVDRGRIGSLDQTGIGGGGRAPVGSPPAVRDRSAVSDPVNRDVARQKIEARQTSGAGVATLPATRQPVAARIPVSRPAATIPAAASRSAAKPKASRTPTARAPSNSNLFKSSSGSRAKSSGNRGRASAGGRGGGGRGGGGGRR